MKYNRIQLRKMAKHLLSTKDIPNSKYFEFIMLLSLRSGKDMGYINNKIKQYATRGTR